MYRYIYVCACSALSPIQLFATQQTVAHQALLSMDFPGKNTVYLYIYIYICICPWISQARIQYIYIYTYIDTHYFHEFRGKLCMFCFSNSVSQAKQVKRWK